MGFLKTLASEHDFKTHITKSSLKAKLGDSGEVKFKHSVPGNKLSFEAEFDSVEVKYDFASKDIELKKKWDVRPGELKIKQRVPASQFFLVPSPEIELKSKIVKNSNLTIEVEPSYSLLDRKAKLEATVEVQKKHKLKFEADSQLGPRNAVVTLSTKPGGGVGKAAKQLSLKYSVSAGPSITHEVEPLGGKLALKSTLGLKAKDLKVTADIKPGKVAGVKPKLTLETKVSAKAPTKPSLLAGLSLDL